MYFSLGMIRVEACETGSNVHNRLKYGLWLQCDLAHNLQYKSRQNLSHSLDHVLPCVSYQPFALTHNSLSHD